MPDCLHCFHEHSPGLFDDDYQDLLCCHCGLVLDPRKVTTIPRSSVPVTCLGDDKRAVTVRGGAAWE